ncbi:hypothetical protein G5V57_24340 [Nordella sp. HKS 07]|uniref:hypothetical protein n=1 Tax=Nordella sp. HKS 07 TaxID=2712222 RepID=UPI0013E179A3|nr:hypothetical protein [Nordella sp. HKS 07]QIG50582.1 hypothetical protein G5V57_24340 [Nordella sp. HKS 07]
MIILSEYRAGLIPAKHAALATPKAARDAVERVLKARQAEAEAKRLGACHVGDGVEKLLAGQNDAAEPVGATDVQLRAAFRQRPVLQIALLYIAENQDRAIDLADSIRNEVRQARIDAKDAATRAKAKAKA